jgi:hypothetical protein
VRRRKWSFPVVWAMDGPPSPERDCIADAVLAALERLGAQEAADAACAAAIFDATAPHGLDPAGVTAK